MRVRPLIGTLGVLGLLASCGRSSLDDPPMAHDSLCHDGTLAGASTPAVAFCSDGSHRAPTLAPIAPHEVWSVHIETTRPFVVDERGTIHGPGFVVADGVVASRPNASGSVAFLDRAGRVVGREVVDHEMALVTRTHDGIPAHVVVPLPVPGWDLAGAPGSDDTVDLTIERRGPLSTSIGWVERIDARGTPRFAVDTGCVPVDGDVDTPTTILRLASGDLASACGGKRASVVVRAFDDTGASTVSMEVAAVGVASNMAQTPDGALAVVTSDADGPSKLWILRPPAVVAALSLSEGGAAYLAVAHDGTVVVRSSHDVLAFAATDDHWALRFRVPTFSINPSPPMGGVAQSQLFVDAESTLVTWGAVLEGRSLDDGTLRFRVTPAKSDSFTYVTAAGPRALYAATNDGTIMLLRDR